MPVMPVFKVKAFWFWFTLLMIAMAFLESAVVVYLRELYYPGGFAFPLVVMSSRLGLTEILREAATLIMLVAAGHMAGNNSRQRFAWFIYAFAVWDIFYYVFLKLLLGWPDTWLTWDILFLIPVLWTGPVIAPILVSLTMILLAGTVLYHDHRPGSGTIRWQVLFFVAAGSVLIFLSFIWDYCSYVIRHDSIQDLFHPGDASSSLRSYVPVTFNWILLMAGEAAEISGILILLKHPGKRIERVK
jgi:hypothetical protein